MNLQRFVWQQTMLHESWNAYRLCTFVVICKLGFDLVAHRTAWTCMQCQALAGI